MTGGDKKDWQPTFVSLRDIQIVIPSHKEEPSEIVRRPILPRQARQKVPIKEESDEEYIPLRKKGSGVRVDESKVDLSDPEQRRKARNRVAAQKTRDRRKVEIEDLVNQADILRQERDDLLYQKNALVTENLQLWAEREALLGKCIDILTYPPDFVGIYNFVTSLAQQLTGQD
jgi:hypothetical protein